MKVLHILRTRPDEVTKALIAQVSRGETNTEIALFEGAIDYDRLVAEIFGADKVICWW